MLDFNYDYGFGYFALFVMSFVGVIISVFNIVGVKFKLVTFILRSIVLGGDIPNLNRILLFQKKIVLF